MALPLVPRLDARRVLDVGPRGRQHRVRGTGRAQADEVGIDVDDRDRAGVGRIGATRRAGAVAGVLVQTQYGDAADAATAESAGGVQAAQPSLLPSLKFGLWISGRFV